MSHSKVYHGTTTSIDFTLSRHNRGSSASLTQSGSSAHTRYASISSKGSASDLSLLQTPQDLQPMQDSVIIPHPDNAAKLANWQQSTSMGPMTGDVLTTSPTDERPLSSLTLKDKPIPAQLITTFPKRARPSAATAHPSHRTVFAPFSGPRSASAVFPNSPTESPTQDAPPLAPEPVEPVITTSQHRRTQSAPLSATALLIGPLDTHQQQQQQQQHHYHQQQQRQQQHQHPHLHPQLHPYPQQPAYTHPSEQSDGNQINNFLPSHIHGGQFKPEASMQPLYAAISSPTSVNGGPHRHTLPLSAPQRVYSPTFHNTLPTYPPVNHFMPTIPTAPPMMYPYFPQAAPAQPRAFYSPPPAPIPPRPVAELLPPPSVASPPSVQATLWKTINPNSQPQMPLSYLIHQANGGLLLGGPSPHNRKAGLFKSELCRNWEEKRSCRYGVKCQFAHGDDEVRRIPRHPKYKSEICRTFWVTGTCPYGKRCCFIHTDTTPASTPTTAGPPPGIQAKNTNPDDGETQQVVSLLARLDLKQRPTPDRSGTPSSLSLTRRTPDTDISDPMSFVYPGAAKVGA